MKKIVMIFGLVLALTATMALSAGASDDHWGHLI